MNILTIKEVALAHPALFVGMSHDHRATGAPSSNGGRFVFALGVACFGYRIRWR
jgi:hypothetical protein